jgi:hypothetical protein
MLDLAKPIVNEFAAKESGRHNYDLVAKTETDSLLSRSPEETPNVLAGPKADIGATLRFHALFP